MFYDKDRIGSETNKNANTGMMCLRELVRTTIINIQHASRQTNGDNSDDAHCSLQHPDQEGTQPRLFGS